MTCPETECREDLIQRINDRTESARKCWHEDLSKVKASCENKVSASVFYWVLVALLSAVGIVAGISYTAYSRSQDEKQESINECGKITKTLDKNVAVMQNDLDNIKKELQKQGLKQEQILEILNQLLRSTNPVSK